MDFAFPGALPTCLALQNHSSHYEASPREEAECFASLLVWGEIRWVQRTKKEGHAYD